MSPELEDVRAALERARVRAKAEWDHAATKASATRDACDVAWTPAQLAEMDRVQAWATWRALDKFYSSLRNMERKHRRKGGGNP